MNDEQLIADAREWAEAFKWNNFDPNEKVDEGLIHDLAAFAQHHEKRIRASVAADLEKLLNPDVLTTQISTLTQEAKNGRKKMGIIYLTPSRKSAIF